MGKSIIDPAVAARQWLLKSLIIPIGLLVFFSVAPQWLDYRLHSAVDAQIAGNASLTPEQRSAIVAAYARISFEKVALGTDPAQASFRGHLETAGIAANFRRLHWGLYLSIFLNVLLLFSVSGILLLNRWAGRSSADLIRYYLLGWRLAMATVILKVFLLVPLLAYGVYELSTLLMQQIFPQLIFAIVAGGLVMLWKSVAILFKDIPLEFTEAMAREVSPAEAPRLWEVVREAAKALNTAPPDHIVVGMQFNFYVTELSVKHGIGKTVGRTLFLSHPGIEQLSVDEVVAIIGHELGHFVGNDTKTTREFYPLRLKANATMFALARSGWVGRPGLQFLSFFNLSFARTEQAMSRQRELLADRKAAELTSPSTMARALVKFEVLTEAYRLGIAEASRNRTGDSISLPFHALIREKLIPRPGFWTELFQKKAQHPLDSHPTLQLRLDSLGQAVTGEEAKVMAIQEGTSAYTEWFGSENRLFSQVTEAADEAWLKLRVRRQLRDATLDSTEGRELLLKNFPEVIWRTSSGRVIFVAAIAAGIGLLPIAVAALSHYSKDPKSNIVLLMVSALCVGFAAIVWTRHRGGRLVLTADQLNYSGWTRPLPWTEVESMVVVKQYGRSRAIRFKLKNAHPGIYEFSMPGPRRKVVTLHLEWFAAQKPPMAETIFRYLTRQAAEPS